MPEQVKHIAENEGTAVSMSQGVTVENETYDYIFYFEKNNAQAGDRFTIYADDKDGRRSSFSFVLILRVAG